MTGPDPLDTLIAQLRSATGHYTETTLCKRAADALARLREDRDQLDVLLANGCLTGDCPHSRQETCEETIFNEVVELRKTRGSHVS